MSGEVNYGCGHSGPPNTVHAHIGDQVLDIPASEVHLLKMSNGDSIRFDEGQVQMSEEES